MTKQIEHTTSSVTVAATVERCFEVCLDVSSYPEWVIGMRSVVIESVDERGRPATVRFEAEGLGRRSSYLLAYDLSGAPFELAWTLVHGDLTRAIEGRYRFHDMTGDDLQPITEVDYELTIDLAVPLPGFVKRRAEDKIVDSALERFRLRVEALSSTN